MVGHNGLARAEVFEVGKSDDDDVFLLGLVGMGSPEDFLSAVEDITASEVVAAAAAVVVLLQFLLLSLRASGFLDLLKALFRANPTALMLTMD